MSEDAPSLAEVTALAQACIEAGEADPFEHFPVGDASATFGARVDGRLAAVAAVAGGPAWKLAVATHPNLRARGAARRVAAAAVAHVDGSVGPVRIDAWAPGAGLGPAPDLLAFGLDFALTRRLLRLEVDLAAVGGPQWPPGYAQDQLTDADVDAVVGVNNRAFAWHEDQGSWTAAGLRARLEETWVDRAGFLVARARGGRVAGFCWTKLHPGTAPIGEIFVICTDPGDAGYGLGRALTLAGLAHLARSSGTAMLYVDDGNLTARRTYRRIGFHLARVDARYTRDPSRPPFGGLR